MQNKCTQNKMGNNAKIKIYPAGIYLLKVINENSRTRCAICLEWTKKTPKQPHWHEDVKKHWSRSGICIPFLSISFLNFRKCFRLGLPVEIKVQACKNYETCKDRGKLSHINQTGQTKTWKETCIEFKKYSECRLWTNIYEIYRDFHSAKNISLREKKP